MSTIAFVNGTVVLPDKLLARGIVVCRDGLIASVTQRESSIPKNACLVDAHGGFITPGFVDLHVHGGNGTDFMDGTQEAIRTACRAQAKHGTTTIFPTTTTAQADELLEMISACKQIQNANCIANGARIAGIHLYGPYFAPNKSGCHVPENCRTPSSREYTKYFQTGMVRIATCAAEIEGCQAFYRRAHKHHCLITCGHSDASWSEMDRAFRLGMRHVDHFWCAMSSVASVRSRLGTPMQGSMLEFVLANSEMSTEVIADGCHLAPELLRFALQMKGPKRLCLVTDCNRALDQPPGAYRFGSQTNGSLFNSDGNVGRSPNGSLASSIRGMDFMVRQMARDTKAPVYDVIRMATLTPCERVGIHHEVGSLEVGKRADVLLLSQRLSVRQVYLAAELFE